MRVGILLLTLGAGALVVACSAGTTDHASPPTTATYEIQFPTTAAAVATDTLQVFVFPASDAANECAQLATDVTSGEALPAAIAQTGQLSLCDVFSGGQGKLPDLPYGGVYILVVAQRGGAKFLSGCVGGPVSATATPLQVSMFPVSDTVQIPATTCMSVSEFCAQPPTCTVGGGDGGT